jgi:hypothetical protein
MILFVGVIDNFTFSLSSFIAAIWRRKDSIFFMKGTDSLTISISFISLASSALLQA